VAKLFVEIGAKVTATDIKTAPKLGPSLKRLRGLPISYILGRHRAEDIVNTDVIIRNPGVPWNHHLLERARQVGIPVLMDTALFMRYFEGTSVGITGTRGKTTTTLLIRALLSTGVGNDGQGFGDIDGSDDPRSLLDDPCLFCGDRS